MTDPRTAFLEAATWHGSLERAEATLAAHPGLAGRDIHTAAVLGDAAAVQRFLADDPGNATAAGGPYGANPLVYLALSKYLRLDSTRSAGFLDAARALLDAGADPNSGFWTTGEHPEFESALYGAAGVAHHPMLTRLLLERGADPNDEEVAYHAPEGWDNAALAAVVETGKLTAESLTTMLTRKADWHDQAGVAYLVQHGADPNRMTRWGFTALHQAIRRDNDLPIIAVMLDHGADPSLPSRHDGRTAAAMAARRGRGDVLRHLQDRRARFTLAGLDRLLAACAMDDPAAVRSQAADPGLIRELHHEGGARLAEFAGNGNTAGVGHLLDLGVDIAARYPGDGYFDIAPDSTALHVAAWRAAHQTVRLLIARGAPVDLADGRGHTPLALAVRACVDSYWAESRAPDSIAALLAAGASATGIAVPTGYAEADALLTAPRQ